MIVLFPAAFCQRSPGRGRGGRRRFPAGGSGAGTSGSAGERFSVTIKDITMLKSSRKNIDFRNEMKEKTVFNE